MKVNNDKHEVHLSREMYDDLVAWAKLGEENTYSDENGELKPLTKIKWHARKFNTPLHIERDQELAAEERKARQNKRVLFRFLKEHTGEEVWWVKPSGVNGDALLGIPVLILGRSRKDKTQVTVKLLPYGNKLPHPGRKNIPLGELVVGLPEGFIRWKNGPWAGTIRQAD